MATELPNISFNIIKMKVNLFFLDYFYFKEVCFLFFKKALVLVLTLVFITLLIYFLDSENLLNSKVLRNYFIYLLVLIFYISLNQKSWLAYFLASLIYFLCIRGFYYYFTFKVAFCLWIISFFFVRELLKYTFNYILFKIKTKYFSY